MTGRGTCDMKGGVAAAVEALRAVASLAGPDGALPEPLAGEALFVGVPSEEDGGPGTLAAIRAGWTGDAAVVTEPTRLAVVTAGAGAITFRLTVPGRAAHASTRAEGVSALEKLEVLLGALRADETRRTEAEADPRMRALGLPYPTIIGIVRGGEWASTVPDLVVAEGRYGVRLGQDADGAFAELRAAIGAACAADAWLRDHAATVVVTGGRFDSVELAADDPLPASLAASSPTSTARTRRRSPCRTGRTCACGSVPAGPPACSTGRATCATRTRRTSRWISTTWCAVRASSPRGSCGVSRPADAAAGGAASMEPGGAEPSSGAGRRHRAAGRQRDDARSRAADLDERAPVAADAAGRDAREDVHVEEARAAVGAAVQRRAALEPAAGGGVELGTDGRRGSSVRDMGAHGCVAAPFLSLGVRAILPGAVPPVCRSTRPGFGWAERMCPLRRDAGAAMSARSDRRLRGQEESVDG